MTPPLTPEQIAEVLRLHKLILDGLEGGFRADLSGADLRRANLGAANLGGADLRGADLGAANLGGADLREANLGGAALRRANLGGADLSGADLGRADLGGADLREAKNVDLALAMVSVIPLEGPFWAWKKVRSVNGDVIAKLLIPTEARRSHGAERKCRSEFVDVLEVIGAEVGVSDHDHTVFYRAGQRVTADSWDENRWETCSHGIHFLMTKEEAQAYSL